MGADRAGNPNVTDETTAKTLGFHRHIVLTRFVGDLDGLVDPLAAAAKRLPPSPALRAALARAQATLPDLVEEYRRRNLGEPLRHLLSFLRERSGASEAPLRDGCRSSARGRGASPRRRLGATAKLRADARVIAATNADLERLMREGSFLRDLYDRLSFEVIEVPPLRERPEDVEDLAYHFLAGFAREIPAFKGKRLSAETLVALRRYRLPGNA